MTLSGIVQAVISAGVTLSLDPAKRKDLLLNLFDACQARAVGLSTTVLHYLLLAPKHGLLARRRAAANAGCSGMREAIRTSR